MKKRKNILTILFALVAIACLQYIRYYETVLYYRNINLVYDFAYGYIAGPLFSYLVAYVTTKFIVSFIQINIVQKQQKILKIICCLSWIVYTILLTIKIAIPSILPFAIVGAPYEYIFVFGGIVLAFTIDMNDEGKG